jgi:DNA-binding CsgD family transcriptional regulator
VRGVVALNRGEPAEAEGHLYEAMTIFRAIGPDTLVWYLPTLGLAQALQGRAGDARACAAETEALLARVPSATMAAGDPLVYLTRIALVLGDRERLRAYRPRLAAFGGQFHDMLTDRLLGEMAIALGDRKAARRYLDAAERVAHEEGLPGELARTLEVTAGLTEPRARQPWPAGLTSREVEGLGLVAGGLSNRQIADALTVSEKTVENHLTNVYGKIGAENRAAATAFAVRHGLV